MRASRRRVRALGMLALGAFARRARDLVLASFGVARAVLVGLGRVGDRCAAIAHGAQTVLALGCRAAQALLMAGTDRAPAAIAIARAAGARAARSTVSASRTAMGDATHASRAAGRIVAARLGAGARVLAAMRTTTRQTILRVAGRSAARAGAMGASAASTRRAAAVSLAFRTAPMRERIAAASAAVASGAQSVTLQLRAGFTDASHVISRECREAAAAARGRALPLLRRAPGPVLAGLAVVVVLAGALAQSRYSSRPDASEPRGDLALPDDRLLAMIEEVARNQQDGATDFLLSHADSPSVVVSMAGLRALRGRPCDRVAALLVRQLARSDWQRRAWAAKVLGENGCIAAVPELKSCLARERDTRVRRQLAAALATLDARAAR